MASSKSGGRGRTTALMVALLACASACSSTSSADDGTAPTLVTSPAATSTSTTAAPSTTTTSTAAPATTSTTVAPTTAAPTTSAPQTLPANDPIAPPAAGVTEPLTPIGRIEIPKIGVDRTMYEGITMPTLDRGPGHWPGTAAPGQVGNTVIAGHRTSHNRDFRDIDDLVAGDEIILTTDTGTRAVYHVTRTEIVKPDAVWIVDQTPTATATLFACHPPHSTRERIVVFADLAPTDT